MNYYPYYPIVPARSSLFGLFRGFNFGSILSGTQKALNLANQAIPLIKQASPMIKNAKTMFRVINEFRKPDNSVKTYQNTKQSASNNINTKQNISDNTNTNNKEYNDGPTFFI